MKPAKRTKRPVLRSTSSAEDQTRAEGWARALASGTVEEVATTIAGAGPKAAGAVRLLPTVQGGEVVSLLRALARPGMDKEVRTAARLALHRLSASGISVAPADARPARPGAREATLYRALGSAYDGNGTRALWLAAERPLGGIYFITMTINDVNGLTNVGGRDTTRKRFTRQETDMRSKDPMAWAELPLGYARQLVQEGVALAREAGRPVPTGYAVWAPVIGGAASPGHEALIYQDIKAFEAKMHPTWTGETPRLFEQPEIDPWFLDSPRVETLARQLAEPASQRLVITPESDEARVARLMREALAELLTDRDLHGLRRRLEETAVIFMQSGREAEAQRAVAAAVTIEEARPLRAPHPFLRAFLDRSIDMAQPVERTGFEPVRLTRGDVGAEATRD